MASISSLPLLIFFFSFLSPLFLTPSQSKFTSPSFVLPVFRDDKTNLHVTFLYRRTPVRRVQHVVDLNGDMLWEACDQSYVSSTYKPLSCGSSHCSQITGGRRCLICSADRARPGCHNNTCGIRLVNPATQQVAMGELAQDALNVEKSNGSNPVALLKVPQYLFACAPRNLMQKGLPPYVNGVAGFGHNPTSLPNQLASYFKFPRKFALCLTSGGSNWGGIFLGEGPFVLQPQVNITSRFVGSTPLIISPQGEYHIQVSGMVINTKRVPINTTRLTMDKKGYGGTLISTRHPYTVLERSIYNTVTNFFANQLSRVPRVAPVGQFKVCYSSSSLGSTRVGYAVPDIDLVLHNKNVIWKIFGVNSMVEARTGVVCLGFVDGGLNPKKAIVIGAHQLLNNFVEFDLARSRLRFTSSVLFFRTTCANYDFTGGK